MYYGLIVAAAVILVLAWFVNRFFRQRLEERLDEIQSWGEWSVEERQTYGVNFIRSQLRSNNIRSQTGVVCGTAGAIFVAASLWYIYDTAHTANMTSDQVASLTSANCELSRRFYEDELSDAVREARILQSRRDALADDVAATPNEVSDLPGYLDAPDWFRTFLSALLAQESSEANHRLGEWDAELATLHERRDELEALLDEQVCLTSTTSS